MANRYWVGDGGNWSDNTNHWSASSGGAPNASLPGAGDDVRFDANSFTVGAQTVTVDATANCKDMDWTAATNTPTFAIDSTLNVYGSVLVFIFAMAISGTSAIIFRNSCTLTTAGQIMTGYYDVKDDKTLTMADAVTVSGTYGFYMEDGSTLITGGFDITCNRMRFAESATQHAVSLGSSTITATSWEIDGGTFVLSAGISTIKISGTGVFDGGNSNYNKVELNGTAHTITGSNTFRILKLRPAGAQTITFTDGTTQTVIDIQRFGTGVITFVGSSTAGWAITKRDHHKVGLKKLSVSYSTALPKRTLYAPNSVDGGNNTNWIFRDIPRCRKVPVLNRRR